MYKVIKDFIDLEDNNHKYKAGDEFPRSGLTVSNERLHELATAGNRRCTALIQEIKKPNEEVKKPVKKVKRDAD